MMSLFPHSLTFLRLARIQFSVEAARHLPSSLSYLSCDFLNEPISKYLPRSLTSLKCEKALLSQGTLNSFPPSITNLKLQCAEDYSTYFDSSSGKWTTVGDAVSNGLSNSGAKWNGSNLQVSLNHLKIYLHEHFDDLSMGNYPQLRKNISSFRNMFQQPNFAASPANWQFWALGAYMLQGIASLPCQKAFKSRHCSTQKTSPIFTSRTFHQSSSTVGSTQLLTCPIPAPRIFLNLSASYFWTKVPCLPIASPFCHTNCILAILDISSGAILGVWTQQGRQSSIRGDSICTSYRLSNVNSVDPLPTWYKPRLTWKK